jgi:hypothetical protein
VAGPEVKDATRAQAAAGVAFAPAAGQPAQVRLTGASLQLELHVQLLSWLGHKPLVDWPYEILTTTKPGETTVILKGRTDANGVLHAAPKGIAAAGTYWLRAPRFAYSLNLETITPQPVGQPPAPLVLPCSFVLDGWMPVWGPYTILPAGKRKTATAIFDELAKAKLDVIGKALSQIADREKKIMDYVREGHLPDFCLDWSVLEVSFTKGATTHKGKVKILSDCLAIGNNDDWIRLNLSGYTSQLIADEFCCLLPTTKLIREMFVKAPAGQKLWSHNLAAYHNGAQTGDGAHQSSNEAMLWQDRIIQGKIPCTPEEQRRVPAAVMAHFNPVLGYHGKPPRCTMAARQLGKPVGGHKKEVAIPAIGNSLKFYGFYEGDAGGQPKFTQNGDLAHGAGFTDYSQGTRLVYPVMEVDGRPRLYADVLTDPETYGLVLDNRYDVGAHSGAPLATETLRYANPAPPNPWRG